MVVIIAHQVTMMCVRIPTRVVLLSMVHVVVPSLPVVQVAINLWALLSGDVTASMAVLMLPVVQWVYVAMAW
jgi:hypothetical protein